METLPPAPARPRWWQNEDWLAVIVGGLLLAAVLAFWRPVLPGFNWMTAAQFSAETRKLQTRVAELNQVQAEATRVGENGLAEKLSLLSTALTGADARAIHAAIKEVETAAAKVSLTQAGKSAQKFIDDPETMSSGHG